MLWVPAVAVAAARGGKTISDAIRQGLTDYVKAAEDAETVAGTST